MNEDDAFELISTVLDGYLDLLDNPSDIDTGDLTDNLVFVLKRAGAIK